MHKYSGPTKRKHCQGISHQNNFLLIDPKITQPLWAVRRTVKVSIFFWAWKRLNKRKKIRTKQWGRYESVTMETLVLKPLSHVMNASLQRDGEINIEFPTTNELSSKDKTNPKKGIWVTKRYLRSNLFPPGICYLYGCLAGPPKNRKKKPGENLALIISFVSFSSWFLSRVEPLFFSPGTFYLHRLP